MMRFGINEFKSNASPVYGGAFFLILEKRV